MRANYDPQKVWLQFIKVELYPSQKRGVQGWMGCAGFAIEYLFKDIFIKRHFDLMNYSAVWVELRFKLWFVDKNCQKLL